MTDYRKASLAPNRSGEERSFSALYLLIPLTIYFIESFFVRMFAKQVFKTSLNRVCAYIRVPCLHKRNIWGNMKVLANNCVSTVKIPEGVNSGNGVSYNPVLGLFVTMDFRKGISVWNHVSGEVMAECDLGPDGDLNMSLLPGNRVAVSYSELYNGGLVKIYSLEKDTFDSSELELKVPSLSYP